MNYMSGNEIKIIQGDTCRRTVTINGVPIESISGVYLSCSDLNISKKLRYDKDNIFVFELSSQETSSFTSFKGDYDLTIEYIDKNVTTALYRSNITVLPKTNKVVLENE